MNVRSNRVTHIRGFHFNSLQGLCLYVKFTPTQTHDPHEPEFHIRIHFQSMRRNNRLVRPIAKSKICFSRAVNNKNLLWI